MESGGYIPSGTGPLLVPAQLAVLSALSAIIAVAPSRLWWLAGGQVMR
jgi:hypothetical protein